MKRYKVVFKMPGGTVIKIKEFDNPSAVLYCLTQVLPDDTATVCVEDLVDGAGVASYETKNRIFPTAKLDGLRAFLGIS